MPADRITVPSRNRAIPTSSRLVTHRVPVAVYAAVLLILPVLVVGGAMASGWWSTAGHGGVSLSGGAAGREGRSSGQGDGQGEGSGADGGPASPADVKGSMTVRQVVQAFPPVTAAEVLSAFGAASGTADSTMLKTLVREGNGTELPAFRTWLEHRLAR